VESEILMQRTGTASASRPMPQLSEPPLTDAVLGRLNSLRHHLLETRETLGMLRERTFGAVPAGNANNGNLKAAPSGKAGSIIEEIDALLNMAGETAELASRLNALI